MKGTKCLSGVYIVRFDSQCIKIGMSKDIERRLKQYAGYRAQAQAVERILLVFTPQYKEIERASHSFAEQYGLPRYRPHEVFDCPRDKTDSFINQYRAFLDLYHASYIHSLVDQFETLQPREPYKAPPVSNLYTYDSKNALDRPIPLSPTLPFSFESYRYCRGAK